MTSFLQSVAKSLLERFGTNLSQLVVVFPGKRARLFLDQALVEASDAPVWTPAYRTISELFAEASPYTLCDIIESVCRLYRIYASHVPEPQTLDQFYNWGEILLSDFDDIDKQLVDAQSLFTNIRDLHALDDNSYITPEQEQALQSFFSNFSLEQNSQLKERFLQLWEHLPAIYADLNASMRSDGLLYEGALERDVISNLKTKSSLSSLCDEDKTYVFVGFNVLNAVEQALFDELQHRNQALFYWDYDTFYVNSTGTSHEAGFFLRRNLERYGNALPPEYFDNFRKPKQFTFITTSSENAQARYLPQWLSEHLTPQGNHTAVVLCNEQLLQPVLHAIPSDGTPLNVTMGFPLADTPVYSFLLALTEMQAEGYDASLQRFRQPALRRVKAHPYTHLLEECRWLQVAGQGSALLTYLQGLITELAPHLKDDLIASESIFRAYTCVNRLIDLMSGSQPLLDVNAQTLTRLLRSVLRSETIPFHGEPAIGLQVMGVLETRALDFRNILMLSVGEGFLPKKVADSSFVPYYLREAFGLTTLHHKIAVYAYYFYRLIQRAEHVTFVYNESNAGTRQNEISRFLRQLLAETDFPIEHRVLQAASYAPGQEEIVIPKTPELMLRLRGFYDNHGRQDKDRRYLSPSALNTYTSCPLKFYYRFVEGMRIEPDPADGLDAILFGEVFHKAAELLYRQLTSAGDVVRAQDLDPFLEMEGQRLEPFVRQAFREEFFHDQPEEYRGILFIARRVINAYLLQLLRHDRRLAPFRILNLEARRSKTIIIHDMEIDLGGIIDRLDLVPDDQVPGGQAVRVVDYKTGGRPEAVSSLDQLFADSDQKAHYYFQTLLYASIVAEQQSLPVTPCLFYVHRSGAEDYSPKLRLGGQYIQDISQPLTRDDTALTLKAAYWERLEQLILDIFNQDIPFTQTTRLTTCENCDFRHLCGR